MKSDRKFDEFDQFADNYRDIHNKNIQITGVDSEYFSEHKIQIISSHHLYDLLNFVDFGCGDGNSAIYVQKYFPSSKYIGFDISEKSIQVAKNRNIPNANFNHFNGTKLPLEDNSVDILFTACVFHHINFEKHLEIMNEIYRVLKPNGKFYIFEHNPWNPITQRIVNTCPFDIDAVLLNSNYTYNLFKKTNFKDICRNYILFFPRNKIFKPFLKFEKFLTKIPIGGQYYIFGSKLTT